MFYISETLVDVSKSHISETQALDKIREYLDGTVCSRMRLKKVLDKIVKEMID